MKQDQLNLALNLHNVRRFATHWLPRYKSVAEHSFRVAAIYKFLGGTEIETALLHDIEESATGDIPSPVKNDLKGLGKYEDVRPRFSTKREQQLCKVADLLEIVFDLHEQFFLEVSMPIKILAIFRKSLYEAKSIAEQIGCKLLVKNLLRSQEIYYD